MYGSVCSREIVVCVCTSIWKRDREDGKLFSDLSFLSSSSFFYLSDLLPFFYVCLVRIKAIFPYGTMGKDIQYTKTEQKHILMPIVLYEYYLPAILFQF